MIVDVEATAPIRQAEVDGGAQNDRAHAGRASASSPERLVADTAYGSAETLAWLVDEQGIEPHIPVFDKSRAKRRHVLAARTSPTTMRDDSYRLSRRQELLRQCRRTVRTTHRLRRGRHRSATAPARRTATPVR